MTSAINPNNIDGAYPVAGQDNDSQGFRDNFTNIKTNFQYASNEITDLQNKVVLKAALSGSTLNNDMGGSLLQNARFQDISETVVSLGYRDGDQTINYAAGPYYSVTASGPLSLSFSNWPSPGLLGTATVEVTIENTTDTLTLPSEVGTGLSLESAKNIIGIQSNVITFPAAGTYCFRFWTNDGGSTVFIEDITRGQFSGSEDLANGAAANLNTSVSYFTTTAAWTATLATGVEGLTKTFVMKGDGGDMVITVTNAGWGGAETVTFTAVGQACTLQYISGKWFCVGNNGAVFA